MDLLDHSMLFHSSGCTATVAEAAELLAQAAAMCSDDDAPPHENDLNTALALILGPTRESARP